jgi:predicted nucleic acid-binding protein
VILLNVTVVVASHRGDHPQHATVRPWFHECLARDERFAVPTTVWASFLSLVTNRRIFEVPTALIDAFAIDPYPRWQT